jgi:hypothetical protein
MKRVWADKGLNIDPKATFKAPDGFNDCDANDPTSADRAGLEKGNKDEATEASESSSPVENKDYR